VIPYYRYALSILLFARSLAAITYVVPSDRFEIERSGTIIVARVLQSHVEKTALGLETVTEVALEESIKGRAGSLVRVHVPGGALDGEETLVPGAPSFIDGERVLLLLDQREDGSFVINDLALGAFHFVRDLVLRDESELVGWDPDGRPHEEHPRLANRFLDYVRNVTRGMTAGSENYFTEKVKSSNTTLHPVSNGTYTATSYMLQYSGGLGARWNVFPSAVNWNQGNSETGELGSGTTQIKNAFTAWNAGGAHYVLASANPNANGFLDASDGVNNIVFEKNLTSFGVQPFSCTNGGTLGLGGLKKGGFGDAVHVFHGETFATTLEADVSMNQGIGNCTTAQLALSEFASVITHELGHTLGFRHSDQNRLVNAPCSTDPTLECNGQAIMNHILVSGLNGHLQTWDKTALEAVYGNASGPACLPPSITQQPSGSTITSGASAQLSVAAAGTGPLSYQWYSGASGNTSSPVSGGASAAIQVSPSVSTNYWARVTGQCAPVADSSSVTVTVNAATCPPVIAAAPRATPVSGGFQLSISVSGGSAFTYRWFDGAGKQIGTGNPLVVNPSQSTTYWCRVANQCGNAIDSSMVNVTVSGCVAPEIVEQPANQQIAAGRTVVLKIQISDQDASVAWFQGAPGNTAAPVGAGWTITSSALTQTTQFWARATNACGAIDSAAATITVTAVRRRSSGH